MAGLTLDAGPLIAYERRDRRMEGWLEEALHRGARVTIPAVVLAEVWRGGPRAARLARALAFSAVSELDEAGARRAGELLAATGSRHTVDAIVVAGAAARGDLLLTSDPGDVAPLAAAAGVRFASL